MYQWTLYRVPEPDQGNKRMKPCPRKHSSVRTLLPWVHSAGKPHLANPHPMEQHSIVVHCKGAMWQNPWQYKHGPNLAQWVNSLSTSVGPFRGDWIDRGTQFWVPKVIPGTPRDCLYPSLSAKRKRLSPLCCLGLIVTKRKKACTVGYFVGDQFSIQALPKEPVEH